jgi:predicted Zn-dependent peptidase
VSSLEPTAPIGSPTDLPTEPLENLESTVTEVEHYELDDIPLFHLPMAGSTILTLAFGVGRAHEPVTRGGMTHLFEHLVMTSVSDALDHSNGTTEPFRVTFSLRGTPADASRFLRDLCQAIEKPAFLRMHEEANVLRTEATARQGMGMSLKLFWARTGYQGIGTVHLPELFLRTLDEQVLRTWIAEHFVAGNAAIWIAGELPADLYVSLAPGPRRPPVETTWIPGFDTPTFVVDDVPGVGASFFVERSSATATAFRTLDRHLRRALRVDRGLGYDVGSDYLPVDADHALVSVWATCLPKAVPDVERLLFETIDDVAARGASDEELAQQYERFVREMVDPMAIPARLDAQVRDVLLGGESTPMRKLIAEHWDLRPDDVASAFRRARDSMLVLIPPTGTLPQRPFKRYPGQTIGPMGRGRTFEFATTKRRAPWAKSSSARLTVGDAGIGVDAADGERLVGIRWEDCVAVVQDPDTRNVLARDGTVLPIVANDWRDGRDAVRLVDRLAPGAVMVPPGP